MGTTVATPAASTPSSSGLSYADLCYWYPIAAVLTANQAGLLATVTVDNDADFLWDRIIANSTGLYSVTLTDKFSSRPLMPVNINGENLAGTAQLPFWLPVPYKIRRTSTIQASFTDRSGAGNTVQFCLVGRKVASS